MNKQKQIQYKFNQDELELVEDSLRYLIACLDSDAAYLYADLVPLLKKVESMVKREGSYAMSEFGKPKDCMKGCDGMVYFDAHSSAGHPTADKWIPLEYRDGIKTVTERLNRFKPY